MNKIYKVVWSKVKNCYVVVSEITKNVITGSVKSAKIGSTPVAKGLAVGAMMAFVITGNVWAEEQPATQTVSADKTFTDETFGPSEFTLGSEYTITHNGGKLVIDDCTFDSITKISGDGKHDYGSVLNSTSGDARNGIVITNSTITNNTNVVDSTWDVKKRDGVIYVSGTDLAISNSYISNNRTSDSENKKAGRKGGAIVYSTGTFTIEESTFINNTAGEKGGAISINAAVLNLDGGTKGNLFSGNFSGDTSGQSSWGGAINSEGSGSTINLTGKNIFEKNSATKGGNSAAGGGGAIGLDYDNGPKETLNIEGTAIFNENNAKNGGAIYSSTISEVNFKDVVATFVGNTATSSGGAIYNSGDIYFKNGADVTFSGNTAGSKANDIYNTGNIYINKGAVVTLDGGINGSNGTININGGTLDGVIKGTQTVTMTDGIWDLAGKSEVSALSGNGTLKVDLTKDESELESVKVTSVARATPDFSGINIDHGGVFGVDVEEGVKKFYKTVVDANDDSLITGKQVGDIFLQAAVEADGGVYKKTTIQPGKNFVIDSDNVTVDGNLDAKAISIDGVDLNETLDGKADKATTLAGYGIADAYTRTQVDDIMSNKIGDLSNLDSTNAYISNATNLTDAVNNIASNVDANIGGMNFDGTYATNNLTVTEAITAVDSQVATNTGSIGVLNSGESVNGSVSNTAKIYADAAQQAAIEAAAADATTKANQAEANAKGYTNDKAAETLANAKGYTNEIASQLDGKIASNAEAIADVNESISGLDKRVASNAEAIADVNESISGLDKRVASNAETIAKEEQARIAGDEANKELISKEAATRQAQVDGINQRLGKMNGKINKVGAGAAALAALHPLEYDPNDKLTFAAGVGNYAGENAAALGAFYRPDEKLMFSLGGTMGNGENMVNLGVSIGLDGAKGAPKLSRKELVEKVNTMEAENANMKAEIAELKAMVAELAKKK